MLEDVTKEPSYSAQRVLEQNGIRFVGRSGENHLYRFYGDQGYGQLRLRSVVPGVAIMYNEYRMPRCASGFHSEEDMLAFDYCREGRMDYVGDNGCSGFFEAGDLCVAARDGHAGSYNFPLSHYIGITVGIDVGYLTTHPHIQQLFPVDIRLLQMKFLCSGKRRILRGDPAIARIFAGFYDIPAGMQGKYYLCKVSELLFYLDAIEPLKESYILPFIERGNIEKVSGIRNLMVENLGHHYTIRELAERFHMSPSTLKTCFKDVFGEPVFSYMRTYRANKAAVMLVEHAKMSIADVAVCVGYANPSKFSDAFKAVMGCLPSEYRNRYSNEHTLDMK